MKDKKNGHNSWLFVLWCKLSGAFLMIFPLLIYASLAGYDANDPSFNKVSTYTGEVHNFLGKFGSCSADAVLSTFGIALIIFLIVPVLWGYGLYRKQAFPEYKTRIFAWIVGMLSLSCFIYLVFGEYLGKWNLPYNLAGEWSAKLSRPLGTYINKFEVPYNKLLMESIVLFVSFISFNFAAGITNKRLYAFLRGFFKIIAAVCRLLVSLFKKAANIRNFREFKEINPSYLQNKTQSGLRLEPSLGGSSANTEEKTEIPSVAPAIEETPAYSTPRSFYDELPGDQTSDDSAESFGGFAAAPEENQNPVSDAESENMQDFETETPAPAYAAASAAAEERIKEAPRKEETPAPAEPAVRQNTFEQAADEPAKKGGYVLPSLNLLSYPPNNAAQIFDEKVLKNRAMQLEHVLNDFNIHGHIVNVSPGPVVTLYELEPKSGTRTARVIGLSDDIARSMAVSSVRMAVVSGKSTIGIELPNEKRQTVGLRELLEDKKFTESKNVLTVALGKDIGGQHVYADLAGMPHLLVAGTTGSGKSVGVNSMILSLLYRLTPEQCRFIMIDPKCVEFSVYNGIPHLLTPVITDPAKAVVGLKWAVQEMENRNRKLALLNVRNIIGYNKKMADLSKSGKEIKKTVQSGFDKETGLPVYEEQTIDTTPMPYIVIVVDEMADLMLVAGKEVEAAIQRLAQMGRAVGIHLIMATQRPSVDVITGVIKANFPSRISFHVTNKFDSTTIIGEKGAEQLLGRGDMLFVESGSRPRRVHGCFVPDDEVEKVAEFIKSEAKPEYVSEVTAGELETKDSGPVFDKGDMAGGDSEEELYRQAVEVVRTDKKASISYVQRKLRIGYNRAANLIERMEREGVVTRQDHVGRREVIDA